MSFRSSLQSHSLWVTLYVCLFQHYLFSFVFSVCLFPVKGRGSLLNCLILSSLIYLNLSKICPCLSIYDVAPVIQLVVNPRLAGVFCLLSIPVFLVSFVCCQSPSCWCLLSVVNPRLAGVFCLLSIKCFAPSSLVSLVFEDEQNQKSF